MIPSKKPYQIFKMDLSNPLYNQMYAPNTASSNNNNNNNNENAPSLKRSSDTLTAMIPERLSSTPPSIYFHNIPLDTSSLISVPVPVPVQSQTSVQEVANSQKPVIKKFSPYDEKPNVPFEMVYIYPNNSHDYSVVCRRQLRFLKNLYKEMERLEMTGDYAVINLKNCPKYVLLNILWFLDEYEKGLLSDEVIYNRHIKHVHNDTLVRMSVCAKETGFVELLKMCMSETKIRIEGKSNEEIIKFFDVL